MKIEELDTIYAFQKSELQPAHSNLGRFQAAVLSRIGNDLSLRRQ